jgi:hypothetical protein
VALHHAGVQAVDGPILGGGARTRWRTQLATATSLDGTSGNGLVGLKLFCEPKKLHLDHNFPFGMNIGICAAEAPNPDVLIWLKSFVALSPADRGWMLDERRFKDELMLSAARSGRIENCQWLRENAGP